MNTPMDILLDFPVRKSKEQKESFRMAVQSYAESLGYTVTVESATFGARNVIIGDPENARFLVTAHYDTCARLPFPNFITPCNFWPYLGYKFLTTLGMLMIPMLLGVLAGLLIGKWIIAPVIWLGVIITLSLMYIGPSNPTNVNDNSSGVVTVLEIARTMPKINRDKVCFVLFDLEETGLWGSHGYRRVHKQATDKQIIINLDCVGDGDHIRLFPTKKLKADRKKLTSFYKACGYFGKKDILVHEKGFYTYPSDQKRFPYGVGICALRDSKFGLCLDKIHTHKDTVLDITNINLLRAAISTYIQTEFN